MLHTPSEVPETPTRRLAIDEELLNSPRAKNLARSFQQRMTMFEDGYDSEGYAGPGPIDIEDEIEVETPLPNAPPAALNPEETTTDVENPKKDEPPNEHVMMSEEEVLKLTITQLKNELKKRAVQYSNSAKKEVLRERLRFALTAELPVVVCILTKEEKDK
jgi:predicted component of type VI protein secretion system